jgi:hypothetical protein
MSGDSLSQGEAIFMERRSPKQSRPQTIAPPTNRVRRVSYSLDSSLFHERLRELDSKGERAGIKDVRRHGYDNPVLGDRFTRYWTGILVESGLVLVPRVAPGS